MRRSGRRSAGRSRASGLVAFDAGRGKSRGKVEAWRVDVRCMHALLRGQEGILRVNLLPAPCASATYGNIRRLGRSQTGRLLRAACSEENTRMTTLYRSEASPPPSSPSLRFPPCRAHVATVLYPCPQHEVLQTLYVLHAFIWWVCLSDFHSGPQYRRPPPVSSWRPMADFSDRSRAAVVHCIRARRL
jgi:hypothetical protein